MTDLYLRLSSVWKLMIMKYKLVYTRTGVESFFSREAPIVDFPGVAKKLFAGSQMWQNFILTTRN